MSSSLKSHFYNNLDLSCKTCNENTIALKCGNLNSITIPSGTSIGTAFTVSSVNVKAVNNIILQFTCNITNTLFYGDINFQVFKLCNNQVIPIPVGTVWTFSKISTGVFIRDITTNSFSFFVCDYDACLDEC